MKIKIISVALLGALISSTALSQTDTVTATINTTDTTKAEETARAVYNAAAASTVEVAEANENSVLSQEDIRQITAVIEQKNGVSAVSDAQLEEIIKQLQAANKAATTPIALSEEDLQKIVSQVKVDITEAVVRKIAKEVVAELASKPAPSQTAKPKNAAAQTPSTPKANQTRPDEQFKDWTLGCEKGPNDKEQCFIYQSIMDDSGERSLLQAAVGKLPVRGAGLKPAMLVTLPLGVYIPQGMAFAIDGKQGYRTAFDQCSPIGCSALIPIEDELLAEFKKGSKLEVMVNNGKDNVILDLSLIGFTAGFEKAMELTKE